MDNMMNAIVFRGNGEYEHTQRPVPKVRKTSDVKIKILAASICGTDVHILSNPPGIAANKDIILGHECVGEVVETGSGVRVLKAGDRVILDNNIPCGVCAPCQSGDRNLCIHMDSMGVYSDGVFAEYAVAPEAQMVKIAKKIPVDQAIFAEPLNCVMGAVKKLKVMPGDNVLILGGGPIGLYFTTLMKASGAGKILVAEVSGFRSEYAVKQGAGRVINPSTEDLAAEVFKETDGAGADIVIDAVGILLPAAIKAVKNGGSILLFGQNAAAKQEICQNDITGRGLTIFGNYIGHYTMQNVSNLLSCGIADFTSMITHRLSLKEFGIGLEAMRKGEALEVILEPLK